MFSVSTDGGEDEDSSSASPNAGCSLIPIHSQETGDSSSHCASTDSDPVTDICVLFHEYPCRTPKSMDHFATEQHKDSEFKEISLTMLTVGKCQMMPTGLGGIPLAVVDSILYYVTQNVGIEVGGGAKRIV